MGVEIEIEGGPVSAPLIEESIAAVRGVHMTQDAGFIYVLAVAAVPGVTRPQVYKVDKSNFGAAPAVLDIANVGDDALGGGIVNDASFIYAVLQSPAPASLGIVNRIN